MLNLLVTALMCVFSIYLYDQFYVKDHNSKERLAISDSEGLARIELGEFTVGIVKKYGIQLRDEQGRVRAFYGVLNDRPGVEGSAGVALYDSVGRMVFSISQANDMILMSLGETGSESNITLSSTSSASGMLLRGEDHDATNEIMLHVGKDPQIMMVNQSNGVLLRASENEKSISVIRDKIKTWTSDD